MKTTMMDVLLSLNHLLDRAGRYFAASEIVSRRPDKSPVLQVIGAVPRMSTSTGKFWKLELRGRFPR